MTPQLTPHHDSAATPGTGLAHLTEDEFGELIAQSAPVTGSSPAAAHVLQCVQCAAELATLSESLALFRHATSAYADSQIRSMPRISRPSRRTSSAFEPTWWVAAAAIFLTALLPMQLSRQHALQLEPSVSAGVADNAPESDEALLAGVDRETSASVPSPMQALADPTATVFSTATGTYTSPSTQRKD